MNDKDIPQENSRSFKKSYLAEPMWKSLGGGVRFNEIAGIDSGPAS